MNKTICDMCGDEHPCSRDLVEQANSEYECEWEFCYGIISHDFCPKCWKKIEVFIACNIANKK